MTPIETAAEALADLWDDATEYGTREDQARAVLGSIDPEGLRDEIAGWPIGSGYYATQIDVDTAAEIAAHIITYLTNEGETP